MYHLPMNPAVGGKPPSDSRNTVSSAASTGSLFHSPAKSRTSSCSFDRLASSARIPKAPRLVTA